jgi:hypothetical protein
MEPREKAKRLLTQLVEEILCARRGGLYIKTQILIDDVVDAIVEAAI